MQIALPSESYFGLDLLWHRQLKFMGVGSTGPRSHAVRDGEIVNNRMPELA
jgi:hypothetical protein